MPIDQDTVDQTRNAEKRGKPKAILYFQRDTQETAIQIANALRGQQKIANWVYAGMFNGPEHVETCAAVIIQATAPRAAMIAQAYRDAMPSAEQFFFNEAGEWVDGPELEGSSGFEMPNLVSTTAVDDQFNPEPENTDAPTDPDTPETSGSTDETADANSDPNSNAETADASKSTKSRRGRKKSSDTE
jgi:hypothetical protein